MCASCNFCHAWAYENTRYKYKYTCMGRYTGSLYFQSTILVPSPSPLRATRLRALPTYACTFRFHPGMSFRERDCAGNGMMSS